MTDLWVFGYGSLMWRPGFTFKESRPALLYGAHRALCVLSYTHRGTKEKPGLVMGLDHGGSCCGIAFRVAAEDGESVIAYLRRRELDSTVYLETKRPIWLGGSGSRRVKALLYTVDRSHPQYVDGVPRRKALRLIREARGHSGPNRDYVINTARHLEQLGIKDSELSWLAEQLRSDRPAS